MLWYFRHHANFAKIYGYHSPTRTMILKFYPLGSLKTLLANRHRRDMMRGIFWDMSIILSLATDVASGINAMHSAGFTHSDIKVDPFACVCSNNFI